MHWERRRDERGKTAYWSLGEDREKTPAQLHEFGKTAELRGLAEHV